MDPRPIDYQPTPDAQRERPLPFSVGGLIGGLVFTCVMVVVVVITARFEEIFRDFNLTLPFLTQMLVGACRLIRETYFIPLAAIPAACAFLPVLLDRGRQNDTTDRRLLRFGVGALILFGIGMLVLIATVLALFMPMLSLIQGMNGPPR